MSFIKTNAAAIFQVIILRGKQKKRKTTSSGDAEVVEASGCVL